MRIKMLPNWCKKLGLIVFLLTIAINMTYVESRESFFKGVQEGSGGFSKAEKQIPELEPMIFEKTLGTENLHIFDILTLVGMLIYLFSKEKIEDDYINMLRLESYQLTAILGLVFSVILYVFSKDIKLTLDYFITLFLLTYLIVFALKKRIY